MKQKINAREKRNAEAQRRKGAFSPPKPASSGPKPEKTPAPEPARKPAETFPARSPEEEAREFLEYLEKHGVPAEKEEDRRPQARKPGTSGAIPRLDLEKGMPTVSEALGRMRIGLQEMRAGHVRAVRLIHGYGSTGRGGNIRPGVRQELADMKRRGQIREYIPGEDFGPMDPASRKQVDADRSLSRDPDYGKMNPGITIVIL